MPSSPRPAATPPTRTWPAVISRSTPSSQPPPLRRRRRETPAHRRLPVPEYRRRAECQEDRLELVLGRLERRCSGQAGTVVPVPPPDAELLGELRARAARARSSPSSSAAGGGTGTTVPACPLQRRSSRPS